MGSGIRDNYSENKTISCESNSTSFGNLSATLKGKAPFLD